MRLGNRVRQVLHGCRHSCACEMLVSPATSATLILLLPAVRAGTQRRLPVQLEEGGDDVKSSWPYDQATHVLQWRIQREDPRASGPHKVRQTD